MLELYHGSNAIIDEIDLSRSKRRFLGCDFYLNLNKSQAMEMAASTSQRRVGD